MRRLLVAVGLCTALLAAGCGESGVGSAGPVTTLPAVEVPDAPIAEPTTTPPEPASTTTDPGATTSPPPGETTTTTTTTTIPEDAEPGRATKVYFLLDSDDPFRPGPLLVPVHREIPATLAVATNSMLALLDGPTAAEQAATPAVSTAVPDDARLGGIVVADGVATVDLSDEFAAGAGSFTEFARLGQVVFTLTQFPTVDAVEFWIDGQPIEWFGGHGIDVSEPQSRADFETLLPFIFVDGPTYAGSAGNPARITGVASVFEATFQYRLADAAGTTLGEGFVTGGSGLGFGPFDFTVAYDVAEPQVGSLVVFEESAVDGERINVREYPVGLTPPPSG